MRDTDIFASLLGLGLDWRVESVELREEESSVQIRVEHVGVSTCPECAKACPVYDHTSERQWRHLDTMQFKTLVSCRLPRVNCQDHGIRQVQVPWSSPNSRWTALFEELAIRVLQMTKSQVRTARLLRLSESQVHDLLQRAVKRGLARRKLEAVRYLSIDEKSFKRGRSCGTVLSDLESRRVLDLTLDRHFGSAVRAFACLPQPEAVQGITMDMCPAYMSAAASRLPQADVVFDRFHVARALAEAVDATRRSEARDRPELRSTRFLWLKNQESHSAWEQEGFERLMKLELKTGQAFAFKEAFRHFFAQKTVRRAKAFLDNWILEALASGLPAIAKVAKMLRRHSQGLLNYVKHKVSNGYAECVNSLIQEIKTVARGFRRFENFRIATLFFLGKLELYPHKTR